MHSLDYLPIGTATPRPGGLVALGIIGLLIGLVSLVSHGTAAYVWITAYQASVPPPPLPQPPPLPAVSLPRYGPETIGMRGMLRTDREPILAQVPFSGPFAEDRRIMLDRLLAECGQDVVGARGTATFKPTGKSGIWESQYFDFENGKLCLDNIGAEATLKNGIKYSIIRDTFIIDGGRVQQNISRWRFRAGAIDDTIVLLQRRYPKLTTGQVDFIADRFLQWNSKLLDLNYVGLPSVESIDSKGVARVQLGKDSFWVLADGRNTNVNLFPQGIDGATGRPWPPPLPPFHPKLPGNPMLMAANGAHGVAGFLLTCFLMVASIQLLVRPITGSRAILQFAWLKSCMVLLELALGFAFFASVSSPLLGNAASQAFDLSRARMGLYISVAVQCFWVGSIFSTLYRSPSISRYLEQEGGLWAVSPRYRHRLFNLSKTRIPRAVMLSLSITSLVLAAAHLAAPFVWHGSPGTHIGVSVVAAVLGIAGLVLCRWSRRATATAALLIVAILLPGNPVAAQARDRAPATTPVENEATATAASESAPVPEEVQARIKVLVQRLQVTRRGAATLETFTELVALGAPAQRAVLEILTKDHFARDEFLDVTVAGWTKSRLLSDPQRLKEALKVLPEVGKQGNCQRVIKFLSMFEPIPQIAGAYASLADQLFDEKDQAEIAARSLAIDGGATMIDVVGKRLKAGNLDGNTHSNLFGVLHHLGPVAHPLLIELSRNKNDEDLALRAFTPAGTAGVPYSLRSRNSGGARDVDNRKVDGPRGSIPISRTSDPDFSPEVTARCAELLRTSAHANRVVDRTFEIAIYALCNGGSTGRAKLLEALAEPASNSPSEKGALSDDARHQVLDNLAIKFPFLDGVGGRREKILTDKQWQAIAQAVGAAIQDPDRAMDVLVKMVASKDPNAMLAAADVLRNVGFTQLEQVRTVAAAFRDSDPATAQLLVTALFSGQFAGEPEVQSIGVELALLPGEQYQMLRRLADAGPNARRVLATAISSPKADRAIAARNLGILGNSDLTARGLAEATELHSDPAFRTSASRLLVALLDNPEAATESQVAQLSATNETARLVAAYGFKARMRNNELGPVSTGKIEAIFHIGGMAELPLTSPTEPKSASPSVTALKLLWLISATVLGAFVAGIAALGIAPLVSPGKPRRDHGIQVP